MTIDLTSHPCFNDAVRHTFGRIHLPVAPKCNIQCRFCSRKNDCVNESRPGVSSTLLSPGQALAYLEKALERDPRIRVVGIAGPGDPLANADETLATLRLVRERYPDMLLCVATNGLALPQHAAALADLRVSHVTVTVNAVDPAIAAQIYSWVRFDGHVHHGEAAAQALLERQLEGICLLKARGVLVKVNCILIPGVNDQHVDQVAQTVAELGADILNCIPVYPVEDCEWGALPAPDAQTVARVRKEAAQFLPQMHHCTRCRADAAGLLGDALGAEQTALLRECASLPLHPAENRPYVAVASMEGVLVNQHLGEASDLWVFAKEPGGYRAVAFRPAPPSGGGAQRWERLANMLHDCRALVVSQVGAAPRATLEAQGIRVVETDGLIETALAAVYEGREIRRPLTMRHPCGAGCTGDGMGCS